jgi:hypothetical protein
MGTADEEVSEIENMVLNEIYFGTWLQGPTKNGIDNIK